MDICPDCFEPICAHYYKPTGMVLCVPYRGVSKIKASGISPDSMLKDSTLWGGGRRQIHGLWWKSPRLHGRKSR